MSNMTIHRIRLSKMQKIINVLAVASFAVSGAVVVSGVYVYVNRDSIVDGVKQQAIEAALGSLGSLGGLGGSSALPLGSNDLSPEAPQAPESMGETTSTGLGVPSL